MSIGTGLLEYAQAKHCVKYEAPPHIQSMALNLEKAESGKIGRLMIMVPPRHGKSLLVSRYFPAWYLTNNPDKRLLLCTYSDYLAAYAEDQVENLLTELTEKEPKEKESDRLRSVGPSAPLNGEYFDCIVVDDILKNKEDSQCEYRLKRINEWFDYLIKVRLNPGGSVIVCQTRWCKGDLSGHILDRAAAEDWTVLRFPAIGENGESLWPEKFSVETLQKIKGTITLSDWEALYQQKPFDDLSGEGDFMRLDETHLDRLFCDFLYKRAKGLIEMDEFKIAMREFARSEIRRALKSF